ncbi:MAG TPA: hypothetical protein VFA95_10500 [Gammaproteobacteria bacterium]|nr:hypothetical protein [Gammaproteobacteria bacterium]
MADAGGAICDASFPTRMLTRPDPGRAGGERLELPWIVRSQAGTTSEAVGLPDRGLLAPGDMQSRSNYHVAQRRTDRGYRRGRSANGA